MGAAIPVIHRLQHLGRRGNCQHRAGGQFVEILVGHDGGNLDDLVGGRVQSGHFQVDPDQVVVVHNYGHRWKVRSAIYQSGEMR